MRLLVVLLLVLCVADAWLFGKKKKAVKPKPTGVLKLRLQARNVFGERVYEMPISAGVPRKAFYLQFDTTGREIMIPGYGMKIFYGEKEHEPDRWNIVKPNWIDGNDVGVRYYSAIDSWTKNNKLQSDVTMNYRRGEAKGDIYEEEFSYGHGKTAIPTKTKVSFLLAKNVSFIDHGIFGLAPNAPFWSQLQQEGLMKEKVISFTLQRPKLLAKRVMLAGRMTMGQVDKSICGAAVATLPVTAGSTLWKSKIHGITFDGKGAQHHADGFEALIDTSSHFIRVPRAVAQSIAAALGAKHNTRFDIYTLPCVGAKWAHPLEVHLPGGMKAVFSRDEMLTKLGPKDANCELCIAPHDKDSYVLGNPFLAKFCTILDVPNHKVVLAKKKTMLKDRLLNPILGKDRLLNPLLFGH